MPSCDIKDTSLDHKMEELVTLKISWCTVLLMTLAVAFSTGTGSGLGEMDVVPEVDDSRPLAPPVDSGIIEGDTADTWRRGTTFSRTLHPNLRFSVSGGWEKTTKEDSGWSTTTTRANSQNKTSNTRSEPGYHNGNISKSNTSAPDGKKEARFLAATRPEMQIASEGPRQDYYRSVHTFAGVPKGNYDIPMQPAAPSYDNGRAGPIQEGIVPSARRAFPGQGRAPTPRRLEDAVIRSNLPHDFLVDLQRQPLVQTTTTVNGPTVGLEDLFELESLEEYLSSTPELNPSEREQFEKSSPLDEEETQIEEVTVKFVPEETSLQDNTASMETTPPITEVNITDTMSEPKTNTSTSQIPETWAITTTATTTTTTASFVETTTNVTEITNEPTQTSKIAETIIAANVTTIGNDIEASETTAHTDVTSATTIRVDVTTTTEIPPQSSELPKGTEASKETTTTTPSPPSTPEATTETLLTTTPRPIPTTVRIRIPRPSTFPRRTTPATTKPIYSLLPESPPTVEEPQPPGRGGRTRGYTVTLPTDDIHVYDDGGGDVDSSQFTDDFEQDAGTVSAGAIPASATNAIIISGIIGGCAVLFFAVLMVFCMWRQRASRRPIYRPPEIITCSGDGPLSPPQSKTA